MNKKTDYERVLAVWDGIYASESADKIKSPSLNNAELDIALDWLCSGTTSKNVLDFGCGNGVMLIKCALRGTKKHTGIDLSETAIALAQEMAKANPGAEYDFLCGDVAALESLGSNSFDAVILANILDNLYPDDAQALLHEIHRLTKNDGKILIKLNPHLSEENIKDWNIRVIEGDLLDDGLLLWNLSRAQLDSLFEPYFTLEEYKDVYYPEHNQFNRLFLMRNK